MISSALFSVRADVIFPESDLSVSALSFLPSALSELESQNKFVLFDDAGKPYGFVVDGQFTDVLEYGNLKVLPYSEGASTVVGSDSMETAAMEIAAARADRGESLDTEMLRDSDFLKYAYYSQRYGSLENYLRDGLGIDNAQAGANLMNSLDPSLANEFLNVYDALDSKQVGFSHYEELLDTLNEMNNQDLSKFLDSETLQNVNNFMKDIRSEVAEKALREILSNVDAKDMELLGKLLKELDYGALYEVARDYMRQLARDGTLDKIGESLAGNTEITKAFTDAAGEMLRTKIWDFLPKQMAYYLLGISAIVLVIALRRVGG